MSMCATGSPRNSDISAMPSRYTCPQLQVPPARAEFMVHGAVVVVPGNQQTALAVRRAGKPHQQLDLLPLLERLAVHLQLPRQRSHPRASRQRVGVLACSVRSARGHLRLQARCCGRRGGMRCSGPRKARSRRRRLARSGRRSLACSIATRVPRVAAQAASAGASSASLRYSGVRRMTTSASCTAISARTACTI